MDPVIFTVPLSPVSKGRPRVAVRGGKAHAYTPKKTKTFEASVAMVAATHIKERYTGPLRVDILAVLPRPKRLMRAKDAEGLVWAPKRPDQDNLRKAILDGLATCYDDDAQVCAGQTFKVYAEKTGKSRTVIAITPLESEAAQYPPLVTLSLLATMMDSPETSSQPVL